MIDTSSFSSTNHNSSEGEFSQLSGDTPSRNLSSPPSLPQVVRWPTKRMEALSDFCRLLVATNSLDSLLDVITHRAVSLVQASFCRILARESDDTFVCQAAYHSAPLAFRWLKGKLEPQSLSPIYQRILLGENPVVIKRTDSGLTENESGFCPFLRSFLAIV